MTSLQQADPDQLTYLAQWEEVSQLSARDDRNVYLVKLLDNLQVKQMTKPEVLTSYENKLLELYEQEWDHQEIVISVLRCLGNKRRHDWSKDYFYIFALAGKFKFKIPSEEFNARAQAEIERHYQLEPHHPQYEQINQGSALTILDIQEMAVDRLSRSVWVNAGKVNQEDMNKYMPEFYGPNPDTNLARYKDCIKALEVKVTEVYHKVIQQNNDNHTLRKMWNMTFTE